MIKKSIYFFIFFIILHGFSFSQVTIGSDIRAEKGSLLDFKEFTPTSPGGETVKTGGILYPRVNLVDKNELFPFFDSSVKGTSAYENTEKPNHKGLTVYNLTVNKAGGLAEGPYYWDGKKWSLLQTGTPESAFDIIDCATNVSVEGEYWNDIALGSQNFIKLTVNVTEPGSYSIYAKPDPDNGYYFSATGIFYTTGTMTIIVPGVGTPKNFTASGSADDLLNIYINNSETPVCSTNVKISDSSVKPNFLLSCNSVKVSGVYKKDIALDNTNYITMTINVSSGAQGATYLVETDVIEGMQFSGTGILGAPGPMTITLYGKGTPITTSPKTFTISTNSALSPNGTCSVVVTPVIAKKKIMAVGDSTFGLTSGGNYGCGAMINDLMNYGSDPNSIVKYEGFSSVETIATLGTDAYNAQRLALWTGYNNPSVEPYDIILITYNETPTDTQRAMLVDYVNRGGVLIYLDQNTTVANVQVVADMFGDNSLARPVSILATCNQVIKMNTGVDDEISNGPFGDVRNGQWGEDYANSCGLPAIPYGAIVYAGATNAYTGLPSTTGAQVTMLRHPSKNFFWCGDSGLIHGGSSGTTTTPFAIASRTINGITYPNFPADRTGYGSGSASMNVCNSTIFANVMAWALNQAETNGINSGK